MVMYYAFCSLLRVSLNQNGGQVDSLHFLVIAAQQKSSSFCLF